ncbi:unnamed protein product [Diamesa tonsa]
MINISRFCVLSFGNLRSIGCSYTKRFYCNPTKLWPDSLVHRFVDHLSPNWKVDENVQDNKIHSIIIEKFSGVLHDRDFDSKTKDLERECLKIVETSDTKKLYEILDVMIRVLPQWITKLKFYELAMARLVREIELNPQKDDFVKLCFYVGLWKKNKKGVHHMNSLVNKYLDEILRNQNVTTIDFAIICTATFKASVKIGSPEFTNRLLKEIEDTKEVDSFLFVAFIKSLRHNRIQSVQVIEKLKELQTNGQLEKLQFGALVHIFPLVADSCCKDDLLSNFFIQKCVKTLDKEARAKDIGKFLWCCSHLNLKVDLDDLRKLEEFTISRTKGQEFQKKFDNFVDVALSLWNLNYHSIKLLRILAKDQRFTITGDKNRIKLDSRKHLLLTCAEIEEPGELRSLKIRSKSFSESNPAPRYLLKPSLDRVMRILRNKGFQDAQFVQQIKNLNIAGIFVNQNGIKSHIEIQDSSNLLSDNITSNGIFALKLRLLQKMNCKVTVVSSAYFIQ